MKQQLVPPSSSISACSGSSLLATATWPQRPLWLVSRCASQAEPACWLAIGPQWRSRSMAAAERARPLTLRPPSLSARVRNEETASYRTHCSLNPSCWRWSSERPPRRTSTPPSLLPSPWPVSLPLSPPSCLRHRQSSLTLRCLCFPSPTAAAAALQSPACATEALLNSLIIPLRGKHKKQTLMSREGLCAGIMSVKSILPDWTQPEGEEFEYFRKHDHRFLCV